MIVDSKNIPQFIDELNIEVDQIKKELQQTIKNVEYASEYSEGVKLGDLIVGSQSSQVIAPQIALTPGPESGQFFLELPVGTESGQIIRPEVQNDANAESLEPEALLTGQTVESYLNSKIVKYVDTTVTGAIDTPDNGLYILETNFPTLPTGAIYLHTLTNSATVWATENYSTNKLYLCCAASKASATYNLRVFYYVP